MMTLMEEGYPVLRWLPDETLFSLASRLHYFWGGPLCARTCTLLFGHINQGCAHDLPSRLGTFTERTGGLLGSAAEIASDRTLLSYYLPFLEPDKQQLSLAMLSGEGIGSLKYALGILTSRFRANHPLKACPVCMQEDRTVHGCAYWHLSHQSPGVWLCPIHRELLLESALKSTGVHRFFWVLPEERTMKPACVTGTLLERCKTEAPWLLSQMTTGLLSSQIRLIPDHLHELYARRAEDNGWVTKGGNLRMNAMVESYLSHVSSLPAIPELSPFKLDRSSAICELRRLMRAPRTGTHPIRHLVLMTWLFRDLDEVLDYLGALHEISHGIKDVEQVCPDQRHEILVDLICNQGLSAHAAANKLHIATTTAMAWAAQAGIFVRRRAKKLKNDAIAEIAAALREGQSKANIANHFDVSIQTITRVLRTEPGLAQQWHTALKENARVRYREKWNDLQRDSGRLGIRFNRTKAPACYAWLYRNDRKWLAAHCLEPLHVNANRKSAVDWARRDSLMSKKVEVAAQTLASGNGKIKLWSLYQLEPELKAKLDCLYKLPSTLALVRHYTGTRVQTSVQLYDNRRGNNVALVSAKC